MKEIKFKLMKDGKVVGYEKHCNCVGKIAIFHSINNDDISSDYEWFNIVHFPKQFISHDEKHISTKKFDFVGVEVFLDDLNNNSISEIPESIFDRISYIKTKAKEARSNSKTNKEGESD
jgi:hypothetical protein